MISSSRFQQKIKIPTLIHRFGSLLPKRARGSLSLINRKVNRSHFAVTGFQSEEDKRGGGGGDGRVSFCSFLDK